MTKLSKLPGYKNLTPEEKKRLKEIASPREEANYNIAGNLSISKKELKKTNG